MANGLAAAFVVEFIWLMCAIWCRVRGGVSAVASGLVRYFWIIAFAARKLTAIAAIDPTATAMIADRGSALSAP